MGGVSRLLTAGSGRPNGRPREKQVNSEKSASIGHPARGRDACNTTGTKVNPQAGSKPEAGKCMLQSSAFLRPNK